MPRLSESTVEQMRVQGFIATAEAAAITGLPASTLRSWALTQRVQSARIGTSLFLEIKSLGDAAGRLMPKKSRAAKGRANKDKVEDRDV